MTESAELNGADAPFAAVAVIGLGLIGASLAGALAAKMPGVRVFGVDTDAATCAAATDRGWCDAASGPDDPAFRAFIENDCELVVIATPVAAVDDYLARLRDWGYTGVVTDTISTKGHILAAAAELLPAPARYVPGHPMAGSEQSGIAGARADLFEGANWILCPDESTVPEDFQHLHELVTGLDARVVSLRREEHDAAVAVVSHVPHIVASSLMQLASARRHRLHHAAGRRRLQGHHAHRRGQPEAVVRHRLRQRLRPEERPGRDGLHPGLVRCGAGNRRPRDVHAPARRGRRRPPRAAGRLGASTEKLLEVRIPAVNRTGVVAEVYHCQLGGLQWQSIDIDHISEGNAVLSLILTDEGDIGQLSMQLINAGFSVSFSPLMPKEYAHVE